MRGEDKCLDSLYWALDGSPPHARGRRPAQQNTARKLPDHPRMRGEDQVVDGAPVLFTGSPPHARGRHGR